MERPWKVRELTLVDPDGHQVRLSQPVDTSLTFEQVSNRVWGGQKT
ncbi:MAG: hypothetical protein JW797_20405 [Bradymonadales bacterium]|nr:hypothetical protein [Bradymonadales bacterium]